jgi:hypothetical protein
MSALKKSVASDDHQFVAGTTSAPVFADPSGRRQRWVRRAAIAVSVPLVGFLAFVTVSLVARPGLLPVLIPGAHAGHELTHMQKTVHRPGLPTTRRATSAGTTPAPELSDSALRSAQPVDSVGPVAGLDPPSSASPQPTSAAPTPSGPTVPTAQPTGSVHPTVTVRPPVRPPTMRPTPSASASCASWRPQQPGQQRRDRRHRWPQPRPSDPPGHWPSPPSCTGEATAP